MAPHTIGGLAHGMAHGGHIRHKNYEFTSIKGLAPVFALSHGPYLHLGDLDSMVHGGHTLRITLRGCILEFTCIGGLAPSHVTGHGLDFRLGSQRSVAHGELPRGMARGGHILLGDHEIARTNGSTPIISFYSIQANHVRSLGPEFEPHPEQCLCN